MKELVIFGTGGFAREVHTVVEDINAESASWNMLGFLDGNASMHGKSVHELPVLGDSDWLRERANVAVIVAVGSTPAKRKIVESMRGFGHEAFATLIHPRAWLGKRVTVGAGTVVCAGTSITTDIEIGSHVILNLDCTVGHDSMLSDYVTVAPSVNVSGSVSLGEGVDVGTAAAVIQGITVGEWSIIGAGAVVVKDLPANVTAVGVPAKPIKERERGWHLS